MRTTCTAALATAAGDTPEWSLKTPPKRGGFKESIRRRATDILNVILK